MLSKPWGLGLSAVGVLWFAFGCGQDPAGTTGDTSGLKLIAEATSGRAESKVVYERAANETRLEVAYAGGLARETIDVAINGRTAATVSLDSAGSAQVAYSSVPGSNGALPLPARFPQAGVGDTVRVGSLTSQFRQSSTNGNANDNDAQEDNDNGGDDDNDNDAEDDNDNGDDDNDNSGDDDGAEEDSLELEARLSEGPLRIEVNFEVESEGSKLEIEVSGGEPGAVLDITIAGNLVGTITLDAQGAGHVEFSNHAEDDNSDELPLPADFVPPIAGDPVTVGPLSGTLAADDEDEAEDESGDDDDSDEDSDDSDDDADESDDDHGEDNANDNGEDDGEDSDDNDNDDDSDNDSGDDDDDGDDDEGSDDED